MLYRLIQDNDGHWFVINSEDTDRFHEWVEEMESDAGTDDIFSECQVDGPHTVLFRDWKET